MKASILLRATQNFALEKSGEPQEVKESMKPNLSNILWASAFAISATTLPLALSASAQTGATGGTTTSPEQTTTSPDGTTGTASPDATTTSPGGTTTSPDGTTTVPGGTTGTMTDPGSPSGTTVAPGEGANTAPDGTTGTMTAPSNTAPGTTNVQGTEAAGDRNDSNWGWLGLLGLIGLAGLARRPQDRDAYRDAPHDPTVSTRSGMR